MGTYDGPIVALKRHGECSLKSGSRFDRRLCMAGPLTREVHVNGETYRVRDIGTGIREVFHIATKRRVGFFIGAGATDAQVHPQGIDRAVLKQIIEEAGLEDVV
jgi:hypothetical protein